MEAAGIVPGVRFRIFNVPFLITGYFWIGTILLGGVGESLSNDAVARMAIWVVCVLVSIVVHELGHALVGRAFGANPSVVLHAIGGLTYLPGARFTRPRSILVSLAGPGAGFLLFGVTVLVQKGIGRGPFNIEDPVIFTALVALSNLGWINSVWSLFNLLPILPLDGGQVLREALGPRWIGVTRTIGGLVAATLAAFCLAGQQIYLTFFLGYLAYLNFRGDPRQLPGGVSR